MTATYYSNGKLLLTSEYLVLDGAKALAIPTKYGQYLNVQPAKDKQLQWRSLDHKNNTWFEAQFDTNSLVSIDTQNPISLKLSEILQTARGLNPDFLNNQNGCSVTTTIDFPRNWGLGTSSTLINNIAQWAKVDAFQLLQQSFGGSGYDIAAAQHNEPIVYRLSNEVAHVAPALLSWNFTDSIFFVHLNQKQDSKEGIARYRDKSKTSDKNFDTFDALVDKIIGANSLLEFENLLQVHESIIQSYVGLDPIKQRLFPDYKGMVKSLGAWGGDFVLVTGAASDMDYFATKGYATIIPFATMLK